MNRGYLVTPDGDMFVSGENQIVMREHCSEDILMMENRIEILSLLIERLKEFTDEVENNGHKENLCQLAFIVFSISSLAGMGYVANNEQINDFSTMMLMGGMILWVLSSIRDLALNERYSREERSAKLNEAIKKMETLKEEAEKELAYLKIEALISPKEQVVGTMVSLVKKIEDVENEFRNDLASNYGVSFTSNLGNNNIKTPLIRKRVFR